MKEKVWRNKQGSYLVEATLTLPVFVLAVIALAFLIEIVGICEEIGHITAREVKENALITEQSMSAMALSGQIEEQVKKRCEKLTDFQVKKVKYLFHGQHSYDLIGVVTQANFIVKNSVGIGGKIQFTEQVVARGFTGCLQDAAPLEASAFYQKDGATRVMVFPKYGKRYHVPSCSVVSHEEQRGNKGWEMACEDADRKGFTACLLCGGGID
ncbi:MAG: hypothetical protein HFE73_10550 [Firmicutes bacterium]|nr:hypothetical protein [Bacillota bacterium]